MKRFVNILGIFFISPEMAFVLILIIMIFLKPNFFIFLASRINTADDLIKCLALVPPTITWIIFSKKDDLLFPEKHPTDEFLQKWSDYHLLLDRYWICLVFGIISSIPTLYIWIFNNDLKNYITLAVFLGGIIVPLITFLTFFNATITLKRILSTIPENSKRKI
jgi:hypothetical protein